MAEPIVRAQADHMKLFVVHLLVYLAVAAALIALNVLTGIGVLWFLWPVGIWSLIIFLHAACTFVLRRAVVSPEQESKATQVVAEET